MTLAEAMRRIAPLAQTEPEAWRFLCDEVTERPQYPEGRRHPKSVGAVRQGDGDHG